MVTKDIQNYAEITSTRLQPAKNGNNNNNNNNNNNKNNNGN